MKRKSKLEGVDGAQNNDNVRRALMEEIDGIEEIDRVQHTLAEKPSDRLGKETIRQALDNELDGLRLSEEWMRETSKRAQRIPWWEREVTISWRAAAAIMLILIVLPTAYWVRALAGDSANGAMPSDTLRQEPMIAIAGGWYPESVLTEGWPDSDD
ncbi:hypothetical protein [Paenibacillus sp. NPDC058071]|uniref:hypothetical protein n=1 Tax=Paenibacillus sp. NPDC058071 TaxID=3346326 RepID=UPI0036D77A76